MEVNDFSRVAIPILMSAIRVIPEAIEDIKGEAAKEFEDSGEACRRTIDRVNDTLNEFCKSLREIVDIHPGISRIIPEKDRSIIIDIVTKTLSSMGHLFSQTDFIFSHTDEEVAVWEMCHLYWTASQIAMYLDDYVLMGRLTKKIENNALSVKVLSEQAAYIAKKSIKLAAMSPTKS